MTGEHLDAIGVGVGPFNLSLAALLAPVEGVAAQFFDRRPGFDWHPGLLLPDARLQTSFLKDLVTAADPRSPYSFLSYLVEKRRFYEFLNADFQAITRAEFADYLAWAAARVPALNFGTEVREIDFDGEAFEVRTDRGRRLADNLVVATGQQRHRPAWAEPFCGTRCFHGAELLQRNPDAAGATLAIIGGGQTGAEVFLAFARGLFGRVRSITWISQRPNFEPLDETHFTNEYFTPGYQRVFLDLPPERRREIVEAQRLASDGISPDTLAEVYQFLYRERHLSQAGARYRLYPDREAVAMEGGGAAMKVALRNQLTGEAEACQADLVLLCTGYRSELPEILAPIARRLTLDDEGRPELDACYRALWDGPAGKRIYLQNFGRHSHGIADPQLSLMAWRSAVIANDLAGRQVYDIAPCAPPITWRSGDAPRRESRFEAA